ncbi:MAG: gamma-glutamylcyclotransferase family protein [Marinosulfonomonas sp.]
MQILLVMKQYIFGYGSLVNRETHNYQAHPARMSGWRRVWRHTDLRPVAYLTALPDSGSSIDGIIMRAPHGDPALEQREHAYDRQDVTPLVSHGLSSPAEIHVYAIPDGKHGPGTEKHPILLSYIDVVVQGYHREFGAQGVQHFFETTDGWDTPILNDRAQPSYPRHQNLSETETEMTDNWLHQLSAQIIRP